MIQKIKNLFFREKSETVGTLADRRGEAYIDTAVKILITVVLGALLLLFMTQMFGSSDGATSDTVFNWMRTQLETLFSMSGDIVDSVEFS